MATEPTTASTAVRAMRTRPLPAFAVAAPPDTADSDSDSTPDCNDRCPTDPLKTTPGACGCGHVDSDDCSFMVVRVGDGSAALSAAATATFIEVRRLDDGTLIDTIPLPTQVSGLNQPLTLSGTANLEGALKRSADKHYVTMAGFAVDFGRTNVAQTASSTVNRVVARVASDRAVDTSTLLTSAFSGSTSTNAEPRSAASSDGLSFWIAGAGTSNTGGIWYIPFNTSSATQITGQGGNNPNTVQTCGIFNGQLYGASNASSYFGVFGVGTGLPTSQAAATILPGFPTSGSSSPVDFAVLDRDPAVAGADTIYVGDDRAKSGGGGIQKWTFNGTTWTLAYTLSSGLTTGIRHLMAVEVTGGVEVLAVTASNSNSIVKVLDSGGTSAATTLVAAQTNKAFRGLAMSPAP
jgi:hypothetical protein